MASAIRDYRPTESDERLGAIIEVAFNHGVSPERGFELILETLRHLSGDHGVRAVAAATRGDASRVRGRLIRRLHRDLPATSAPRSPAAARCSRRRERSIAALLEDRDWLFADESLPHRCLAPGGRGADVAAGAPTAT